MNIERMKKLKEIAKILADLLKEENLTELEKITMFHILHSKLTEGK